MTPASGRTIIQFRFGSREEGSTHPPPDVMLSPIYAGDMSSHTTEGQSNRERLFRSAGIDPARVVKLKQIHSKIVHRVFNPDRRTPVLAGDGLVSSITQSSILAITVSDCLPIFLADSATGAFGVVHSGWRGTGIIIEAIELMRDSFGSSPGNIQAIIGPGIHSCCYSIPSDRIEYLSSFGADVEIEQKGKYSADLVAANLHLLSELGIEKVSVNPDCTSCSAHLGSHRRQGPRRFTRMLALIGRF